MPFFIIFLKVFKTLLKFFLIFSMLSKIENYDLKIAYGVKGYALKFHRDDNFLLKDCVFECNLLF